MAFNRKQRLRDNIEAIRTAFILDRERRTATAEEQAILRKYCGFGGLKCILNPAKELTDAVHWAKSDLELFAPTVELHRLARENSKDDTEYKRYVDAMKQSVLTAFYPPPEITGTIADVLHEHGIRPDRVLEPSAGVGAFVDAVLENKLDADIMAFEKDLMTGKILGHLHPDQKVRVQGFEKIEKPFTDYFDLAISNIPFGDVAVFDPEFTGSRDPARRMPPKPQAQVTPKVTTAPPQPSAIPLTENRESHETKPVSFAAKADPDDIYATLDWDTNPSINGFYEMMMDLTPERRKELRRLAAQHQEKRQHVPNVKAASEQETRQPETQSEVAATPAAPATETAATSLFPEMGAEKPKEEAPDLSPRPYHRTPEMHLREGSMVADSGRRNIGYLKDITPYGATFQPLGLTGYQKEKALLYVSLRDAYERLYRYESNRREENPQWREHLNTCYDEFVMRYGNLNAKQNVKLLMMDAAGRDILSLERAEDGRFVKADIFERPVSFSVESHANVSSPEEALSASLNKFGTVNLDYMREITDSTEEGLLEALKGRIFYNPLVTGYEIKDRFIAGNVIEKAERIEAWMGDNPENGRMPEVKQALEALKEAEPPHIAFEDLDFNFGECWIPTGVYAAYMSHLFDTDVKIAYSASMDEFSVACGYRTMKITDEFLVKGYYRNYDGMHLLKHALHNTCPDMMKSVGKDEHGNDIKVRDSEGIQLANAKIDEIRNGFSEWLEEQSPQFKERLTTMYNRKFNCFVRPKYDGSHQTFPNLNLKGLASRGIKSVYPSQMDCVWMLKQNGGGICDHEVGTGKMLIMCIAAHEMKRLNLAHKPMIIGLKANVAEIATTYQAAYPNARILYASEKDFSTANRVRFFNNIKNNDYDCVMTSSARYRSRRSCSSASCKRNLTRWRKTSKSCGSRARTCRGRC